MRFLADQDVWFQTIEYLRNGGHGVLTAGDAGRSRTGDLEMLRFARSEQRLFITRDKDFGSLVFLEGREAGGVIFLRITPASAADAHDQLRRLLSAHTQEELSDWFCVVEPHRHRIRRLDRIH
jgi:predicted nuclease of predicted toxin-antitoxin system